MGTEAGHTVALEDLKADMGEVKQSLSQIANAITRIAVLEERSQIQTATQERIVQKLEGLTESSREHDFFKNACLKMADRIEKLEEAERATEKQIAEFKGKAAGIGLSIKLFWAIFGLGGLMTLLKLFGLIAIPLHP